MSELEKVLTALDGVYGTLSFEDRLKVFLMMKERLISLYNVDNHELNMLWLQANKCKDCMKYKCKCK